MIRFIADLGGISGLYVGITIYTLSEVIDLLTQYAKLYCPLIGTKAKLLTKKQRLAAARIERRLAEEQRMKFLQGKQSGAADSQSSGSEMTESVTSSTEQSNVK